MACHKTVSVWTRTPEGGEGGEGGGGGRGREGERGRGENGERRREKEVDYYTKRGGEGEGEDEKRSKFYPQLHWEQLLN